MPQHLVDVGRKLGLKLSVLDVVDVQMHDIIVDGAQPRATGAQMGMVVRAVKELSGTRLGGDNAE